MQLKGAEKWICMEEVKDVWGLRRDAVWKDSEMKGFNKSLWFTSFEPEPRKGVD